MLGEHARIVPIRTGSAMNADLHVPSGVLGRAHHPDDSHRYQALDTQAHGSPLSESLRPSVLYHLS